MPFIVCYSYQNYSGLKYSIHFNGIEKLHFNAFALDKNLRIHITPKLKTDYENNIIFFMARKSYVKIKKPTIKYSISNFRTIT